MKNAVKRKDKITAEDLDDSLSGNGVEIPLFMSKDGNKTLSVICGGCNDGRFHCVRGDSHMWNYNKYIAIEGYNNV